MRASTIFCIFGLAANVSNAQWLPQFSGTTRNLSAVWFTDANTGTAVGDSGTILRTTNGGATWGSQSSGTTRHLNDVSFANVSTGTAVGDSGTILHTTNGGVTWVIQESGTRYPLNGVSFSDANTGTVVGGRTYLVTEVQVILRTTNGGTTWFSQTSGAAGALSRVWFTDSNIGTAVGFRCDDSGVILHTTNAGLTWTSWAGVVTILSDVCFTDANTGIAVGEGGIQRTTNGGATWEYQPLCFGYGWFSGISFCDSNSAVMVGFSWSGDVVGTTDRGATWTFFRSGTHGLVDVSFTDGKNGWAVGGNGTILRTTNGGVTFVEPSRAGEIPKRFVLEQNCPNPFNPVTNFQFTIPHLSFTILKVYDVLGREVATLVNDVKSPGTYTVQWDASKHASGIYFYKLQSQNFVDVKKLLLLR